MRLKKGYKKQKNKWGIGKWLKRHLETRTSRRRPQAHELLDKNGHCRHFHLDEEGKCAHCGENWAIWKRTGRANEICESDGCTLFAEWRDPMENKLCSDCVMSDVETGEYSWEECEAL